MATGGGLLLRGYARSRRDQRACSRVTYGRFARKRCASATRRRGRSRRRRGRVEDRGRVDDPDRQPCSAATADQWASRPQPMRSAGNGSSTSKVCAENAVSGPISAKRDSRTALPRRRRVTSHAACECRRCAGCASGQARGLGAVHEAVEEAARQDDVVVDDEQPVVAGRVVLAEQRVQVLELAVVAHRDRVHRDLVARAVQLDARGVHQPPGPLDAEHEHAPARRVRAGRAVDARAGGGRLRGPAARPRRA